MYRAIMRHACLLLALFIVIEPAEAAKRVALVIGINSYPNLPPERQLKKAVNDAQAIRDTLKADLGFKDVFYEENADRIKMKNLIRQAEAHIERGDIVFIYFSGHGVSIGSGNYLLPSDVPEPVQGDEAHLIGNSFEAEALAQLMLKRGAKAVFSVLDACRDNPFVDERGKNLGDAGGLRTIDQAQGVFTLFAAGLGQVALDRLSKNDSNPNSVFTRSFIPLLKTSGLSQVDLAKRVQAEVVKTAAQIGHKQMPVYNDGLEGFVTLKELAATDEHAKTAPQTKVASIDPTVDELIRQCDMLTSHGDDPDKPAAIEAVKKIASDDAVGICEKAADERPDLRRLIYQTGRAYDHARNYEAADSYYKRAAAMGSKAAMAMLSNGGEQRTEILEDGDFAGFEVLLGPQPSAEAIEWGKRSLRNPNSWRDRSQVSFIIGYYYDKGGDNLPPDPRLARAWYAVSLDEGGGVHEIDDHETAYLKLVSLIGDGKGGRRRPDVAASLLLSGYCRGSAYDRTRAGNHASDYIDVARAVQEILKQRGFYSGDIDGVVGSETHKALEQAATTICPIIEESIKAEGGVFASLRRQGVVGEDPRKELQ